MDENIYPALGAKVREARESAGLTQTDLGTRLRISRSSIANIEAGRQAVYVHHLMALASALGKPVIGFLPDEGCPRPATGPEAQGYDVHQIIQDSDDYVIGERK